MRQKRLQACGVIHVNQVFTEDIANQRPKVIGILVNLTP